MPDKNSVSNRKEFEYELLEFAELQRIDGPIRLYETPEGKRYPSVTTVLGKMTDKSALEAWKKESVRTKQLEFHPGLPLAVRTSIPCVRTTC